MRSLHIDTDPGLDDLLALALALACPEARVRGVTTVAGNSSIEAVTDNAARFLGLCGARVPLGRGADGPLSLERAHAEEIHGIDGRQGIPLPQPTDPADAGARDVMLRSLELGVDCIVALGPLTNLAQLVLEQPGVFDGVDVVWMGGTLTEGNVTPLAEFNAYADPEALGVLLASDVSLHVIGLDVTRAVVLRRRDVTAGVFGNDPIGHFLEQGLSALMEAEHPIHGEPIATLHDPCAVAAAVFPDLFRYEELSLEVKVEAGRERGRLTTRPDRKRETEARTVKYATEVRASDVVDLVLERLGRLDRAKEAGS